MLQSLNGIPFTKNWKTSSLVKSERFNKTKTKQNKKKKKGGRDKRKRNEIKENNKTETGRPSSAVQTPISFPP